MMTANQVAQPNLRNLNGRLAAANGQVGDLVEGIFEYVGALDDAASRSDWHEVRRMAELIVVDSLTYGLVEMADAADQIVQASTASVCLADIEEPLSHLKQASADSSDSANTKRAPIGRPPANRPPTNRPARRRREDRSG